jgi:hypothetical protein
MASAVLRLRQAWFYGSQAHRGEGAFDGACRAELFPKFPPITSRAPGSFVARFGRLKLSTKAFCDGFTGAI